MDVLPPKFENAAKIPHMIRCVSTSFMIALFLAPLSISAQTKEKDARDSTSKEQKKVIRGVQKIEIKRPIKEELPIDMDRVEEEKQKNKAKSTEGELPARKEKDGDEDAEQKGLQRKKKEDKSER